MNKNHQDLANDKLVTTEGKIWLPPSYNNNKPPPVSSMPKKRGINWGFAHKSFWEWLLFLGTLLAALGAIAVPFVVTIIGLNFTQQQAQLSVTATERQHQTDLRIAQDQQQATILQTYLDNIQDLLLNHNLLKSSSTDTNNPYYDVAILARARTLTALQGLDSERKGRLLTFLYEAKLIGFNDLTPNGKTYDSIINLRNANLSGAYLYNADLNGANLVYADLSKANLVFGRLSYANLSDAKLGNATLFFADLSYANLNDTFLLNATLPLAYFRDAYLYNTYFGNADLREAKFSGANLSGAYLGYANLSGADLSDANLNSAYLGHTNLSGVHNLSQQQLDQVSNCKAAILPKGLTCHHNQ